MTKQPQKAPFAFDDASEACHFLSAFESGTEGFYQYEVSAFFDADRNVAGYHVRVKDLDGFGVGFVHP